MSSKSGGNIRYKNEETGEITGDAFITIGRMTIIDWSQKKIVEEREFRGDKPVTALRRDGDYAAQWPMFEIVAYLESLPRK